MQVNYLGAIGGKDVAETTQRILHSLMTNGVARRMNFAGRDSKTGISDLKILDVVIGRYIILHFLFNVHLPSVL